MFTRQAGGRPSFRCGEKSSASEAPKYTFLFISPGCSLSSPSEPFRFIRSEPK